MEINRKDAFLILNSLPHIGPITVQRLLEDFNDDPLAALCATEARLLEVRDVGPVIARTLTGWSAHVDLEGIRGKLSKSGVQFISRECAGYPRLLRQTYDAPTGLYWRGQPLSGRPCVGFVGTRRATLYGTGIAQRLARELAQRGVCIVSGLARGIDTAAHKGALEAGGETIGVLGCGIDIVYPPENYELYQQMTQTGAVVSEFPFGRRADKQTFPMRNRIIAGMCLGVVIVESAESGGAMITARFAAEQGRQVFAVPGRIDQEASRGCHMLIREGATLVTCAEDILNELNMGHQQALLLQEQEAVRAKKHPEVNRAQVIEGLSEAERRIHERLVADNALTVESVAQSLGMSAAESSSLMMMLELKGVCAKRADGFYELI